MADTIFFTEFEKNVQDVLDARKNVYAKRVRDTDSYQWLYQKMAWANASAENKAIKRSAVLLLPSKGGIKDNGLYTPVDIKNNVYVPDAHLNSVKISNIGDWGSVVTCQLDFSVYSLAQLDSMQPFFDIGADVTVNYGWSRGGVCSGKNGEFTGKVYNFSYSVNVNGGFDCTVDAMGEGINVLGVKSSTSTNTNAKVTDDATNRTYSSILGALEWSLLDAQNGGLKTNSIDLRANKAIANLDFNPLTIGRTALTKRPPDKAPSGRDTPAEFYITLESFVKIVNDKISRLNENLIINCNDEVTKGPTFDEWQMSEIFCSANPAEIIFPGSWKVAANVTFDDFNQSVGSEATAFAKGYPGTTFINIQFLINILKQNETTLKQQKSPDGTIKAIFQKIFDAIYYASGELIKLTITQVPNDTENEVLKRYKNKLIIAESSTYTSGTKPNIYKITAVTEGSICRNMSMTTKVPQELQTAAFVVNSPDALAVGSEEAAGFARIFGSGEPRAISADNKTAIVNRFKSAAKRLRENYLDSGAATELKAVLREINNYDFYSGKRNRIIPFPIDLSVTLDGISGIVFGNTFTVNYLPAVYTDNPNTIAFTVTKVEHEITGNDWTTTLSTVCRMIPKSIDSGTSESVNWRSEVNKSDSAESQKKLDEINKQREDREAQEYAAQKSNINELNRTNNTRQPI